MFDSSVLEIIIVLVFVYLIYSLLTTIVVEIIASIFRLRARSLRWGVIRMLQDSVPKKNLFLSYSNNQWMGIKKLFLRSAFEKNFVTKFFDSPSIKYLGKGDTSATPSYIEAEVFSKTILDILKKESGNSDLESVKNALGYAENINRKITISAEEWNNFKSSYETEKDAQKKAELLSNWVGGFQDKMAPIAFEFTEQQLQEQLAKVNAAATDDQKFELLKAWQNDPAAKLEIDLETRLHLCSLLNDANENLEDFKIELENWFNQTMDRVKGWYKRKISGITFFVGLFLAISFNVDTIYITKQLKENTALTKSLVVQAELFANENTNVENPNDISDQVKGAATKINESLSLESRKNWHTSKSLALFGWLLTAIAISFGAPFWFDLLNKLMQLRSAMPTKTDSSKDSATPTAKKKGSSPSKKRKGVGKIYG